MSVAFSRRDQRRAADLTQIKPDAGIPLGSRRLDWPQITAQAGGLRPLPAARHAPVGGFAKCAQSFPDASGPGPLGCRCLDDFMRVIVTGVLLDNLLRI